MNGTVFLTRPKRKRGAYVKPTDRHGWPDSMLLLALRGCVYHTKLHDNKLRVTHETPDGEVGCAAIWRGRVRLTKHGEAVAREEIEGWTYPDEFVLKLREVFA